MDSPAFFLRLLVVLNIEYAVERCFLNGRIVNKNVHTFFNSLGEKIFQEQRKLHIDIMSRDTLI